MQTAVRDNSMAIDEAYVGRLAAGDHDTERHFVIHYGRVLKMKLWRSLRSDALIQDVCQETLLRVLLRMRRGGISNPHCLNAFVNAVCKNVALELLRGERRAAQQDDSLWTEPADERIDLDGMLAAAEIRKLVTGVLAQLSPKDRGILKMLFLEERDKQEICRLMEVDRSYLRVLVFRARRRFRNALQRDMTPLAA